MKKKYYEKPTTQVVELQQQAHMMLQTSPLAGQNDVQDYNWNNMSEE